MNVFVTGATGFVGSAVVDDLIRAGHNLTGLARSEAAAARLTAAGARVQRGDLTDTAALRAAAAASDAVIHTAFVHDFSNFKRSCDIDAQAIEALGDVLAGSERPLIVTSGLATVAQGRPATEADRARPASGSYPRRSEAAAEAMRTRGVRALIVRLAPTVHGTGDHGFVPMLFALAARTGVSAYVGDGTTRWAAVHRLDAASAYRLALSAPTSALRLHAVAEDGIPFRDIAAAIGRSLNLPVVSKSPDEAAAHFGFLAPFVGSDMSALSQTTRTQIGWQPQHPGLLTDLARPNYFSPEVLHV